jgi:hypothetical protein
MNVKSLFISVGHSFKRNSRSSKESPWLAAVLRSSVTRYAHRKTPSAREQISLAYGAARVVVRRLSQWSLLSPWLKSCSLIDGYWRRAFWNGYSGRLEQQTLILLELDAMYLTQSIKGSQDFPSHFVKTANQNTAVVLRMCRQIREP